VQKCQIILAQLCSTGRYFDKKSFFLGFVRHPRFNGGVYTYTSFFEKTSVNTLRRHWNGVNTSVNSGVNILYTGA
jgi:hypothetical protein